MTTAPKTTEAERAVWERAACRIATGAGKLLMHYYRAAETDSAILKTEIKEDDSPVTAADKASHAHITKALQKLTPHIPVVSEENENRPVLEPGKPFWVVDPLDGTKEFIHRTGGFSVKIALIDGGVPVLGAVYCPAQDVLYYSREGAAAFRRNGNGFPYRLPAAAPSPQEKKGGLTVLFNERHASRDSYTLLRENLMNRGLDIPEKPLGRAGLPRNLQVAEGLADIFADCGRNPSLLGGCGFGWDYAPDFLILKNAGGLMVEAVSGREPSFADPYTPRNAYVSFCDRRLGKRFFP